MPQVAHDGCMVFVDVKDLFELLLSANPEGVIKTTHQ